MCIPVPNDHPRKTRSHPMDLGTIAETWAGWTLHPDGRLYCPGGRPYTPAEVQALPYLWEMRRELERPRQFVLL